MFLLLLVTIFSFFLCVNWCRHCHDKIVLFGAVYIRELYECLAKAVSIKSATTWRRFNAL